MQFRDGAAGLRWIGGRDPGGSAAGSAPPGRPTGFGRDLESLVRAPYLFRRLMNRSSIIRPTPLPTTAAAVRAPR